MSLLFKAASSRTAVIAQAKKGKTQVVKPSSTGKVTKGWFGGEGGAQTDLDKWYGECPLQAGLHHNCDTSKQRGECAKAQLPMRVTGDHRTQTRRALHWQRRALH